jgi:DNA-binding XRE family transcriptional regulator
MAPPTDSTAEHQQRLAALVAQRRAQLRLKKQDAAATCDLSYMTYWKIEAGQSVRPSSYAKIEVGFGFRAGSCKAVLDGSSNSVFLEDGTELITGGTVRDFRSGSLEEEVDRAFDKSAQLTAPGLTLSEARALKEEMFRELRERGVLKSE